MQNEVKLKIALECSEKYDCGNCKYISTNGFMAPSGRCNKHPEFKQEICIDRVNFPTYATICDYFEYKNFMEKNNAE